MKTILSSEQLSFFRHNQFVEIADLMTKDDCATFLSHLNPTTPFKEGRNVHRRDPWLQKCIMRKTFSETAKQLFKKEALRFAFDHFIVTSDAAPPPFHEPLSLNAISSFQSLLGAVCILLSPTSQEMPSSPNFCPVPTHQGNGLFFSADLPIDLPTLFTLPTTSLLIIAFGPEKTVYIKNPSDPFTHLLKRDGYGFGDRLQAPLHPLFK